MNRQKFTEDNARTGTNLRRSPLPAWRNKQLERWAAILGKAITLYRKQSRKLFTRAERRLAVPLMVAGRQALLRDLVQQPRGATQQSILRRKHRRKLDRELARVLPNLKIWQRLTRDYRRHVQKTLNLAVVNDLQLGLLGDFDIDLNEPLDHAAPFPLYDAGPPVNTSSAAVIDDSSLVVPESGDMLNRCKFDHDGDSGFGIDAWFQLERAVLASQAVAVGIHYTVPATGRLQLHAVLQNFVSRVLWYVTDLFGLSYADLRVEQRLFIRVVRRGDVTSALTRTIMFSGVENSSGLSIPPQLLNPIDNALPYEFVGTTEEIYQTGENLQIFVGSEIFISSDMNDMASHVDALVWWRLQQLSVSTV